MSPLALTTGNPGTLDYDEFLREKVAFDRKFGFDVDPAEISPALKPHQAAIVRWAVAGGRRAIFAKFGLGKSVMQLEILRQILQHPTSPVRGGRALVVAPLGVRGEFIRDGRNLLDAEVRFVRRTEDVDPEWSGIYVTNYESVRDGKLDVALFDAVSLDEASVLRSFGSKTYQEFLGLFDAVPYRFVATATPSPNRHKELIHYAGFLGIMDTGAALTRFFQRDSSKAGNLQLYPHKRTEFWLWLNTWGCFLQRPSDLCECSCHGHPWTFKDNASAVSSRSSGEQRPAALAAGSAVATAEATSSSRRATSSKGAPAVAAASDQSTAAQEAVPTESGSECADAAATPDTRTGQITAAEESASATAGSTPSLPSSKTWESRLTGTASTALTTTGTTSPATVDGRQPSSRPRTADPTGAASSCDVCRCDHGYELPPIDVRWHEVAIDLHSDRMDRDGQGVLVRGGALSMVDAAREKRQTMDDRIAKALELVREHHAAGDEQLVIWCHLNDEQTALERALTADGISFSSVHGSLADDEAEARLDAWRATDTAELIGKPVMLGQGMNLQQAHVAIFVGIDYKFNDTIQAVHRIQRYGQTHPVVVHLIYAESETEVRSTLEAKWIEHDRLTDTMSDIIREHGLDPLAISAELTRAMGVERDVHAGDGWTIALNDSVVEWRDHVQPDSMGLIVTSIPFGNHYEYSPNYADFGHTDDNDHFWWQMDYLTPSLLRALKPGRIMAVHVKDRLLFGSVTGKGRYTVSPLHAEAIAHYTGHGFDYHGMITVTTDVVRENNQTYRLSYSKMLKDHTPMGVGSPEYVLLFGKPQTDRTKGWADERVTKDAASYTVGQWQIDAAADWRTGGDRLLSVDELMQLDPETRSRLFTEQALRSVYDYDEHVRLANELAAKHALPGTFASLVPGSWHPAVWHDVLRIDTLNSEQKRRNVEQHICPFPLDIPRRLINEYSNEGDLVGDPFSGLGSTVLCAVEAGRQGFGSELNPASVADSLVYLRRHDQRAAVPTLFDLIDTAAGAA